MQRTAVLNVVGLTPGLISNSTPHIQSFRSAGASALIDPVLPAVTCTAQSTYLTGLGPTQHGIVANGWYDRSLAEVQFWKQSNHLVQGSKLWEHLRALDPNFTCAKLFWWYNMYSTADYSITPRPSYPADGRKVFDIYTSPSTIRAEIKSDLGEFPFPCFWGPAAGVDTPQGKSDAVSRWIAESAKWIEKKYHPTLSLIYLPHLDYNLQRLGPRHPSILQDLKNIDQIVGELLGFFDQQGVKVVLLSEYGITPVERPIHLNRRFRERGWLVVREELGLELLDAGASKVFAVADHQIAHIYVNDPTLEVAVREVVAREPGVKELWGADDKARFALAHSRAGDLVALATEDAWFTYYYWLNDAVAPDFARCVDIHRKPGYDPVELFLDPALSHPRLKIAWRLLQKKLGMRMLMDVIPLDASLVQGSHGVRPASTSDFPLVIVPDASVLKAEQIHATAVCDLLRRTVVG